MCTFPIRIRTSNCSVVTSSKASSKSKVAEGSEVIFALVGSSLVFTGAPHSILKYTDHKTTGFSLPLSMKTASVDRKEINFNV